MIKSEYLEKAGVMILTDICAEGGLDRWAIDSASWICGERLQKYCSLLMSSSCGGGSASTYLADLFAKSRITAFSNSRNAASIH